MRPGPLNRLNVVTVHCHWQRHFHFVELRACVGASVYALDASVPVRGLILPVFQRAVTNPRSAPPCRLPHTGTRTCTAQWVCQCRARAVTSNKAQLTRNANCPRHSASSLKRRRRLWGGPGPAGPSPSEGQPGWLRSQQPGTAGAAPRCNDDRLGGY